MLRKHASEYLHQSTLKNIFKSVNTSTVIVYVSLFARAWCSEPPCFYSYNNNSLGTVITKIRRVLKFIPSGCFQAGIFSVCYSGTARYCQLAS